MARKLTFSHIRVETTTHALWASASLVESLIVCACGSLLDIARDNDLELEGACEGTLACSTCHCVLEKGLFDKLPAPVEEELDMLDLAAALTDT